MHWTVPAPAQAIAPARSGIADQRVSRPLDARTALVSSGFGMDSTSPVSNAVAAPLTTTIQLSYGAVLSAATVTSHTIAVHSMMQGLVTATHSVNANVVTITPTRPFLPGELVWTSATTGTQDLAGNPLSRPYVWQFNAAVPAGWGSLKNAAIEVAPAADYAKSMAWGDFDGDGDPDLAVGGSNQTRVYVNDGDGTFGAAIPLGTVNMGTDCVAWADYDGDGDLDLAVGSYFVTDSYVYPNNGDGTFGAGVPLFGGKLPLSSLAWGDFNGDGRLDVAYGLGFYGNYVLLNNGAGGFPNSGAGMGGDHVPDLAWADFNNDGMLDVAIAAPPQSKVYINSGAVSFGSSTNIDAVYAGITRVESGDFDKDGDLDLVTMSNFKVKVLPNNGAGTFGAPTIVLSRSNGSLGSANDLSAADIDGDGDLDLYVGMSKGQNLIYLNNGDGTFDAGAPFGISHGTIQNSANSSAWADVDGDGDLDLAVTSDGKVLIYLNAPDPSLSALTLSTGKLTPVVDPTTWAYAARVPYATTSVVVTGTTADVSATLSYGACTGGVCALQPGFNVFTLTTTARDGTTTQDYVLTIERGLLAAYSPAANAFNAPLAAGVALTYRVPLNASTVTSRTVSMHGAQSGKVMAVPVVAGNKVTVAPAAAFFPGELVWTTAVSSVTDVTGTHVLPTVWQFNAAPSAGWGRFTAGRTFGAADASTNGVAWGDFNGDGSLDLAMGAGAGQNAIYMNDGFGAFDTISAPVGSPDTYNTIAAGDFDGDGHLDLITASDDYDDSYIYFNDGAGDFSRSVGLEYLGEPDIATGDFNGDGHLDISLSSHWGCGYIYLNNGDGTFAPEICLGKGNVDWYSLAAGDFDGDGDLDLAMGMNTGQSMVYPNNGNGTFGAGISLGAVTEKKIYALAWGDYDNDGDLDLAAGSDGGQSVVFPNNGNGAFGAAIPVGGATDPTRSMAWGDGDNDGDLDLLVGNFEGQSFIYPNNGDGTFGAGVPLGGATDPTTSVAWGDANGDGALDVVMGQGGDTGRQSVVYLNERPNVQLSGLALSAGTLTPAFVSTTTAYSASVPNAVASIVVTATTADVSSTVSYGGCTGNVCTLNVGANVFTVTVTHVTPMGVSVTAVYTLVVTRAAGPTPTPTATPTATRTPTPGGPTATPVPPTPTPTPETFAPFVSPSYGSVNTSTVSIIGPVGSGFTGATRVSVNGVKMFHVVRSDRKIDFTMKPGVAGTTVDVVLVKAGGVVMTFTQSYSFEGPTSATGSTSTGATLTTTNGVTITVPPQTALRPASAEVGGGLVITYTPVDVPAVPPGDVPLSFFDVSVAIDGAPVSILTNAATLELPVDPSRIPAGQQPWLFAWVADDGVWQLVPGQSYDPAAGLITAPANRLGTYVLMTAAMRQHWFPQILLR